MAGAPTKFKQAYTQQAYKLCLLGATDAELAEFFEVCEETINNWKRDYPRFREVLKKGKMIADAEVADSLLKRAKGFSYVEETFERVDAKDVLIADADGSLSMEEAYRKRSVLKVVPGDVQAQRYWLNNRQPTKWRDASHIKAETENTVINYNSIPMTREEIKDIEKELEAEY